MNEAWVGVPLPTGRHWYALMLLGRYWSILTSLATIKTDYGCFVIFANMQHGFCVFFFSIVLLFLFMLKKTHSYSTFPTGRTSEVLKLQQKVNELTAQNEDLRDEKKHLTLKVKEVEADLEVRLLLF
jgi:uncharacterized protein YlxW (UPF0749 family)